MGFADEGEQMRLVSSRTLLTAVAGLIAVPGAAIAAAGPDTALLQVGSQDEEIDCEEYLGDLDGLGDLDAEIPEECSPPDEDADEDDGLGDGEGLDEEDLTEDAEDLDDAEESEDAEDEEVDEEPSVEDVDVDDGSSELHGEIVSTVAHCAPRGQERVEGFDLPNLGAYASTAARGEVLSVEAGDFDLSTLAGAEELCSAIEQARADDADGASSEPSVEDGSDADAASTRTESRPSSQRGGPPEGKGNGRGAAQREGGPGNSANAAGRNR
jgi:hypothetical protein